VNVWAAVGLLAGGLGAAGCELAVGRWSAEQRGTWSRTYILSAEGRFELANTNGKIVVQPSSDDRVHVTAEKVGKGASEAAAREALEQIEILEQADGSVVRLETKLPHRGLFGVHGEVSYTIQVPATIAVKVENTNGRIELADLRGPVDAETTNGAVRGRSLHGAVRASTTNGGINLDLAAVADAGVEVSTTNGRVELALPADAKATVSARCTNGGIKADGLSIETTESTRRHLEGRLNGGGPRVWARTTNGAIRLVSRNAT
jgi:hypothetical protein